MQTNLFPCNALGFRDAIEIGDDETSTSRLGFIVFSSFNFLSSSRNVDEFLVALSFNLFICSNIGDSFVEHEDVEDEEDDEEDNTR
jgi:hypothetical protein